MMRFGGEARSFQPLIRNSLPVPNHVAIIRLVSPNDHGLEQPPNDDTRLADVVGGAVVAIGLQAALAVALHTRLWVHVRGGRLGGRAARAAGVLRPVAHLIQHASPE